MNRSRQRDTGRGRYGRGFTLIELLVVVAIIAILMSVLLPALGAARKQAKAIKCAAHQRSVGQAVGIYLAENRAVYPPSYIYPFDASGNYDLREQPPDHPHGYIHWSWFLFGNGQVKWEAFTCPEFPNGGIPRTNPGPNPGDWEGSQVDQNGATMESNASLTDRQAPRIAFTANAAVIPRNKLSQGMVPGNRRNQLVQEGWVVEPRGVILAAEFHRNWKTASISSGGNLLCKSHRPVSAFYNVSSGTDEYSAPLSSPGFRYGIPDHPTYGLRPANEIDEMVGVIDGDAGIEINVVGRHHPGEDELGGSTNFLFTDGHVERMNVLETMRKRYWGGKYYSLTGPHTEILGDD